MDLRERVFEERLKGHCCSESIMNMCLEDLGRGAGENEELVRAMGAFCGGLHVGLSCGTLCGALSALYLALGEPRAAGDEAGAELTEWFRGRFGAWNCAELLEGDESRKLTLCPVIVEDTYFKLREMLEDRGAM